MKVVIINFIYNECSIEPSMLFLWQFDVKKKIFLIYKTFKTGQIWPEDNRNVKKFVRLARREVKDRYGWVLVLAPNRAVKG